ncbi:MAG: succinyldiaminopimelate transaminase [Microbacteriaceae bacterium]|nr:succinyldiaminopimelate transaminase [Microbacteriaceae bacterium]
MSLSLPDFPWDSLDPYRQVASSHPDGLIDLSVGSPVDPSPAVATDALASASQAPSYPLTAGTPELQSAMANWWQRRRNTGPLSSLEVVPSIGSKEMVGLLPTLLGVRAGHTVVIPEVAYPTYAIGAVVTGADVVASDDPSTWPDTSAVIWLNSPGNPTGRVNDVGYLREAVRTARAIGATLVSDECYAELGWGEAPVPSLLDSAVTDGDRTGLLSLYSLSKQSNLAGYRAALVAGDEKLIQDILLARKHLGLIVPAPIQAAMTAVLGDDAHAALQKERYRARRDLLMAAFVGAGFQIDHSEAGLYLWATKHEDAWQTIAWLAERGILVAPGSFYGPSGSHHVRVAFTASDDRMAQVPARLSA